jgi:hypothetical protein
MNDQERIEKIRKSPATGAAGVGPDDAAFLLGVIAAQGVRLAELEKKSAVLSHHVLELTEELENVKMDFGGGSNR